MIVCVQPLKQQWAVLSMPQALLFGPLRVINWDGLVCISHPTLTLSTSLCIETHVPGAMDLSTPLPLHQVP